MKSVTTEKAMNNQIASAEMEGIRFDKKALKIIRQYADNEITHEELVRIVTQSVRGEGNGSIQS